MASESKKDPDLPPTVKGGRYKVGVCLGTGGFGYIHLAEDTRRQGQVAIKFEATDTSSPQLVFEANAYRKVAGLDEGDASAWHGVPRVYWYGTDGAWNMLVMQRLGPSLESLMGAHRKRKAPRGGFSLKTVCMVADQVLTRLERIHAVGLIHRDLKPDNFLMGIGREAAAVYIVDFGLVRPYLDAGTGAHHAFGSASHNAGTMRYASIGMQKGWLQSRRDDLESAAYVLLYLAKGRLPWQGLKVPDGKDRDAEVLRVKTETPLADMCAGLPPVFADLIAYARDLDFEQAPDYGRWRMAFRTTALRVGLTYDGMFDWTR